MSKKFKNIQNFEALIEARLSSGNLEEPTSKKAKKNNHHHLSDLELVIGIYRLLVFDFDRYSTKWSLAALVPLITGSKDPLTKWFSLKISSLLLGLSAHDETVLFNSHFSPDSLQHSALKVEQILLNDPELKLNPNEDVIATNFAKSDYDHFRTDQDHDTHFVRFDNGPKLRRHQVAHEAHTNLVFVASTVRNLNKIVMSVVSGECVVVEGALSSGKTCLIEYLSEQSGHKLVKYQMDEFMDSKSLIGNYVCSEIPGEFVWKPGPLFSSVQHGSWILLEDFDHAPLDSLSLLIDLLETKGIKTSDNQIALHEHFRLFLTLRPSDTRTTNTNFIDTIKKLSRSVLLEPLSDQEIVDIVCQKYPSFGIASSVHLAQKLLDIYKYLDFARAIDVDGEQVAARETRCLSLRDLLKVCNRMKGERRGEPREMLVGLLNDVYECFLCFVANRRVRGQLAVRVGAMVNVGREEVQALLINKKPDFAKKENSVVCGRVRLGVDRNGAQANLAKFVYTRSALNLLEKIARCIECNEPVLLCGETGVGKTTALQHLAGLLGKKISVINLNQQTETSDLLGSFKPVDIRTQMKIIKEKFVALFSKCFDVDENRTFLNHVQTCYSKCNWKYLLRLVCHATESASKKLSNKRAKNEQSHHYQQWKDLKHQCQKLQDNLAELINKFTFQFFDGKLSEAIVNGEWILLDEMNMASAETLQFLGTLLDNTESGSSSIILHERGDHQALRRHVNFRLFGAMNPASDVGKRNLPANIRNRFTEIFVDELDDQHDLALLTKSYLQFVSDSNAALINSIVAFYQTVRDGAFLKKLSNGCGMPPTYSLRTLCRALKNASFNSCQNSLISVYDSLCLSFLTDLNRESSVYLEDYIRGIILKSHNKTQSKIQRNRPPLELYGTHRLTHVNIDGYWVLRGQLECINEPGFIFTKSASDNLKRLCRVCSARLPCLIQGDTSIGKTSLIKWLAAATGNRLIRINNHDHTDLAEYIGSYVMDGQSRLLFKEGLLVEAMRHGYWILLDELNLASSEVLEALNRVLDDNRELYIPESQQVIKAHPGFLLFATQNPPGKYAGRKQLSKAFRNRFIELHYDELPEDELLTIVEQKCQLPKSYATLLIKTISDLKTKRSQVSSIFLGKDSLITLRDLFRWARRYSKADHDHNTDWKQYLAEQGFLLLTSRCRAQQDVLTIHASIQKTFGKQINIDELNEPKNLCPLIMRELDRLVAYSRVHFDTFVWTPSAKRTALLASLAYKFNEPFLLVGETGVGKTTICQMLAHMNQKTLSTLNCHMHSEASDFLGSMRPVRQSTETAKLFEWKDGPLVTALKHGHDFLIDEISLADDSVLERLNSVLEEEKTLLLAENITESQSIRPDENFRLSATMNPSGDFGKKELSAALRNRFTEIWCPAPNLNSDDFKLILEHTLAMLDLSVKERCIRVTLDFMRWLQHQTFFKSMLSVRDLTHWVAFMNRMSHVPPSSLLMHAASLVFIDSFSSDLDHSQPRQQCVDCLVDLMQRHGLQADHALPPSRVVDSVDKFECGDFVIEKGHSENGEAVAGYVLDSPTTVSNLVRVMRCMVMDSPIMLEGSPGVGKTSLVQALGRLTNNKVVRINLSEQTDLNELFGADLPVGTDQSACFQQKFEWFDGPFLLALKRGYWVILDEINLASQSVLEGLNSCLDHRGEIFISELNRTFTLDKHRTKIFACQNPFSQGGGRKGLPKSFLNRFAKVYVDKMSHEDLLHICQSMYAIERDQLSKMIQFNSLINQEVCVEKKWGSVGSPWEFNLRDLFRWCDLLVQRGSTSPAHFVYLIYASRFRDVADKKMVYTKFESLFGVEPYQQRNQVVRITSSHVQIGQSFFVTDHFRHIDQNFVLTNTNLKHLESIVKCVEMNWMVVLVGRSSTGKTSLVRLVASLLGKNLVEFSVNNSTDTSDLLGGYEKIKHLRQTLVDLRAKIVAEYRRRVLTDLPLLCEYFEFVFRSKKVHRLNDEDLDEVKELCKVFREGLERLGMNEHLALLDKLSHYEKMKFEWVDSALVKSIENGDWVLIDNANFCAPSVLDRLNPLLEPNGRLQINEKGIQQDNKLVEVQQNKNFRLFLSMNEQFGELSRPMRNRGCEIYLNELDTQQDIEDVYMILKSLFPMPNYFYSNTKFGDLFKVYKLAYDHWLIDNNTEPLTCFANSALECRLQHGLVPMATMPTFYTNLNNIKNSQVYSFLFNYSLMDTFRQIVSAHQMESRDLHLNTLHNYHQSVLDTCNYVIVLVRNLPVGALAQVIRYLQVNLTSESLVQFFDSVLNGEYMNVFVAHLRQLGHEAGMQLDAETVDLTQNVYLCQKLASFTKFKQCENMCRIFGVYINLELFKYRVNSLYTIQSDSFYFLVENSSELSQHKYLLLVKELVSVFCDCVLRSQFDGPKQQDTIQMCTLLIEKFYLILSSRFDQLLTSSYLKYYWNLIRANVHNLKQIDNIWSTKFNSIFSVFDQNLSYDDSLYKIFYDLWSKQNKQHINLYNDNSLATNMDTISNFMTHNSFNAIMSCRNFTKSINNALAYFSNEPVTPTFSREHIEILAKHIADYQTTSLGPDLKHQLNIILNKSFPLMLHHYSDTVRTLLNPSHHGRQPTSLSHASLSELIIGDFIFDLSSKCTSKNLTLFKSIEHLLSAERLDSELIGGYQAQSLEPLNMLAHDFLTPLMAKMLLNSEQRLDLTLNFYDLKLSLIHSLTNYIWSNHTLLSDKKSKIDQINKELLHQVRSELSFVTSSEIEHYLFERGFDRRFLTKPDCPRANLLVYGLFYLIMYCPMGPLDPVEHDVLVQKNQLAVSHTLTHLEYLGRKNLTCRHKICLEPEPVDAHDQLTDRLNKPVYYLIKNEIENFLKQFLAYDQVWSLWSDNRPSDQFSTWLNSIESLINKLKSYYNYSDVIGRPVRGLSLIWHAMSSMYTERRAQTNELALELMQYPVMDSYVEIAERMSEVKSNDMHLVALMNGVNSVLVESVGSDRLTRLVVKVCDHFGREYFEHKRKRDEDEQVDAYKYKQYGQEKIEQELEERELESKFPSYEHNFSEFIQINVLDDEKKKETKVEKDSFVCLFDQVYDLISRIYEPCKNEKFILDTFLKSYTIGTGMIRDTIIQNSHKNTLLSHILFSTTVNLREEKKLFDIYHDSNCEQVLALKKCLDSLTKRIESVLREWPQNPVLVELTKIVNKIESFNLNDPLMKYLTGIELLLGRADSWQLIASRDVSLDSELKALNHLVVEWRKLELKQWMNSCESEMDKIKKENAFVWFFTIYSTCSEYLGAQDQSDEKLVSTLFQFMASAPIGQFSMRLKSIHVCHLIFSKFECAKSKSLNKMLWSVWSFYESLYSGGVRALIAKHQADIDKELRDFVTIYKWQDATYWSIKNSVAKSNRHFVRTIKKFKVFLQSEIDWSKIANGLHIQADRVCHAAFLNEPATSHYAGKMQKFCSTILSRKFKKNKFNRLCSVFVDNVRQRFDGLAQETRQLTNGFVSDKKNAPKYKKEFKYLNQEKLKFMSDLIKRLNLMGLSYRKGQIMATRYTHIEQVILGHKTQLNSHFEFYLSARRFFDYKSNRPSQQAVNLPLDKFNGYVNHLFSFVHSQRLSLTKLSLHMAQLAGLNCKLATIVKLNASSWSLPTSNVKSMYLKLNWAYAKIRKLLIQMKYFYENLFNLGQSEIVLSITNQFDQVKCALENVLNLIPGEKSEDELEYANELSDYVIDRDPLMHLGSLIHKHCEPFYEYYSECIAQLDCVDLDAQAAVVDEPIAHHSSEHHSIEHCVQRTKTKVLKIVENFYKKYSHYVIKELESDHFFTLESLHNFTSDCESLQLDTLVKQIRKILSLGLTNRTGLVDHVTNLKSVLDVFWRYVSAYEQHLGQAHVKCCQMLETLVKVFDEYKQGLSVPKELEQDDNESAENETDEKKFSTDDAAGLGEGQGSKDVSDQIENEDQLDDAKTKEQREEDDQEEEQADKVDEEEKGIEMSEDFEAKMDDVNMDEEAEQEDKEDEEDLDDQKGDVDNAMDYLDEQLWDKEDNEAEQEGQDEENELDEDIHGGDKLEDTSELLAKEQDLPMIDNEENKTQDDEERAPEHNDDEQSANEKNEQDIDLMKEGSDDEMKEEMEEEKGKENEQANEEEKENGKEEEEEVEKMPEENQIEEMESLTENGEQKEEEEEGEKNLNENSKNYGCNELAEKSENESNKLNWCGDAEDNEQMSDEQNEADVNQEADNEKSAGQGQNELSVNSAQTDQAESRQSKMRQKNQNRVLDDQEQKLDAIKDLNIVDVSEEEMGDDPNETSDQKGVEFKHLNDQDEKSDQKMYDAATDEQKKPQRAERHQQDEQIKLDQEESRVDQKENKKLNAKQFEENKQKEEAEDVNEQNSESKDEKMIEADYVSTMNAQRPSESVFATLKDNLVVDISRETVERDLAKFKEVSVHEMVDCESLKLWLEYEAITQQLSRELCEQLRLILEPTICSKLKGDYKTGKRLNMKRVVEYIATEYRKDKIWLRRTKPNKRDYQVVLAVDNSSSMSDNHCMQLAYETIATLTNAFSLLEVGQFGLVSFGEKVEPLHALSEHFNSNVGARILSNINFNHERTKIAEMLDTSIGLFSDTSSKTAVSKLLIILSDGRGVFYEGIEKVKSSVQRALVEGIFIVFVILDITGTSTSSIYDIKMPVYSPGNPIPAIKSYMENFPFPFYICLRDVNSLPMVMIEALKQWFDMVSRDQ